MAARRAVVSADQLAKLEKLAKLAKAGLTAAVTSKHGEATCEYAEGLPFVGACRCGHPIVATTSEGASLALRDHMGHCT